MGRVNGERRGKDSLGHALGSVDAVGLSVAVELRQLGLSLGLLLAVGVVVLSSGRQLVDLRLDGLARQGGLDGLDRLDRLAGLLGLLLVAVVLLLGGGLARGSAPCGLDGRRLLDGGLSRLVASRAGGTSAAGDVEPKNGYFMEEGVSTHGYSQRPLTMSKTSCSGQTPG